jgi:NADH:ubiquinone oxidoreductase subunit E
MKCCHAVTGVGAVAIETVPSFSCLYAATAAANCLKRRTPDMPLTYHPHHPDINDDMWTQIDVVIERNRTVSGAVITVLRECQDIAGYLPVELLDYISQGLNLPSSSVYGVASFYSLFSMVPKGRHTIKMCLGTACYVKGIKEAMSRIESEYQVNEGGTTEDRRFSLEAVRCLGACGLAPVMVVGQDTHGDVSSDKVIELLEQYE